MSKCKNHSGRSLAMAKALGEANLLAWSTEAAGQDVAMPDPGLTVLQQLRVASLRADLFGLMLRWQLEVDEEQGSGAHMALCDMAGLAPGVYTYTLSIGGHVTVGRFIKGS